MWGEFKFGYLAGIFLLLLLIETGAINHAANDRVSIQGWQEASSCCVLAHLQKSKACSNEQNLGIIMHEDREHCWHSWGDWRSIRIPLFPPVYNSTYMLTKTSTILHISKFACILQVCFLCSPVSYLSKLEGHSARSIGRVLELLLRIHNNLANSVLGFPCGLAICDADDQHRLLHGVAPGLAEDHGLEHLTV